MTQQHARYEERFARDPWTVACEYIGFFATECHFTPDQVFDMPWVQTVRLSLMADDMNEQRRKQHQAAEFAARNRR